MKRWRGISKKVFICGLWLFVFGTALAQAQVVERTQIPAQYRWDLTDLYPSVEAWKATKAQIAARIDESTQYQGQLGEDAEILFNALTTYFTIKKELTRLDVYASLLSDEDVRISDHQELVQEINHLITQFREKTAYVIPELLQVAPETIAHYLREKPALEEFSMFLDNIQRRRAHTLSEPEEKILASAEAITESAGAVYGIFDDAEMPRPDVTLSNGETVSLGYANYIKYRSSVVREDRQIVIKNFFEQYAKFKNTLGANLVANLKNHHFYAKNKKYSSSLEAALDKDNIPVSLYENLISQIHNSLPTLHRFLDLKKRMLNVDTLHYYDLYASIVKDVDLAYTVENGQGILLKALHPLGPDYVDTLKDGFEHRWVDYMPTPGKRSGGYSNGDAYDVHPYILMNWIGDYDSLSTLAHEVGHTMHSFFSNREQPFAKSHYAIFVAEIASTLNENLLNEYLIARADSDDLKLSLLGNYLECLRSTIFRQVLFAEFEWKIHQKIEKGEPLTGETLSELYYDLVKTYYGHDEGFCVIDPEIAYEWAYIPHFYYDFYVYKYATSLIYATALTEKILQDGEPAVERYFNLLTGGNSKYPTDIVRDAGVDPFSSEAFELTMKRMNHVMDQIEAIIGRRIQ